MYKPRENIALYITVAAIAVLTVIFCITYSAVAPSSLQINLSYYFVYQYTADNAVSASSLSDATESFGGAGYILAFRSKFYITVACYYDETSANSVCLNLKNCGMECDVLAVSVTEKSISGTNSANAELFSGNINTLEQLGKISYNLANSLDKGEVTQSGAKDALSSVLSCVEGLYGVNTANCFSEGLSNIITICNDILSDDYIYSKSARKLQIAIIDSIINVDMA